MKLIVLNRRVEKELLDLGDEIQASLDKTMEYMTKFGTYALGMPHVRKLQHPLWEIRLKDVQGIARVIFVSVVKNEIVILHAFRKKTEETPKQAIDLAMKRLKEV